MVDIIVSTPELSVLGGPETVNVELDFGATGDRGSQIFVNTGKPEIALVGGEYVTALAPGSQVMDLYINILSSDDEYQYVYQLQNVLNQLQWVKLFKLVSQMYSHNTNSVVSQFVDGELTIDIELSKIVSAELIGSVQAENFNVQHNILNTNPTSSGLSIPEIVTVDEILKLRLILTAVEFFDGNWVNLSGQKTVHLFITVV